MGVTPKQARFVREYLVDLNATQAAIRAGYSRKTAGSQAHDLLKKPEIAALVAEKQAKVASRVELTAERVLADLQRIAASAESVGEFAPAVRATELLGKHLKLFTERVEHSGSVQIVDPYARPAE